MKQQSLYHICGGKKYGKNEVDNLDFLIAYIPVNFYFKKFKSKLFC